MEILNGKSIRLERVAKFATGKILDIGYAGVPNKYLNGNVIGFDLYKSPIPSSNYKEMIVGDATNILDYFKENEFDSIVATEFIEHIENHITFFRNCNKLLKIGGRLVLSTPFPYFYKAIIGNIFFKKSSGNGGETAHVSSYRPTLLNGVAKMTGFKIVKIISASRIFLPPFTWQMIYVYEKNKDIKGEKVKNGSRGKTLDQKCKED